MKLAVFSHIWPLLYWGVFPIFSFSGIFFYHKWVLGFLRSFSASNEMIMIFICQFLNVMYHIDWFVEIEKSLPPWAKSHLIMRYNSFNVCWNQFASILLRVFASMFTSDMTLQFSFSCYLYWFLVSGWWSILCDFLEAFQKDRS